MVCSFALKDEDVKEKRWKKRWKIELMDVCLKDKILLKVGLK